MLRMINGDIPEALATLDEAKNLAEHDGMVFYYPYFGLMRGMMQSAAGEIESASKSFQESKVNSLRLGMLPLALQAGTATLGLIGRGSGDESAANAALECESLMPSPRGPKPSYLPK